MEPLGGKVTQLVHGVKRGSVTPPFRSAAPSRVVGADRVNP